MQLRLQWNAKVEEGIGILRLIDAGRGNRA